jgi:hypothetical protein
LGSTSSLWSLLSQSRVVRSGISFDRSELLLALEQLGFHNDYPNLQALVEESIAQLVAEGQAEDGMKTRRTTVRRSYGHDLAFAVVAAGFLLPFAACGRNSAPAAPAVSFAGAGQSVRLAVEQAAGPEPIVQLRFEDESRPMLECVGATIAAEPDAPADATLRVRAESRARGSVYVPEGGGPAAYRYSGVETAGLIEWEGPKSARREFSGEVEVSSWIQGGFLTPEDAPGWAPLEESYLPALAGLLAEVYGPAPLAHCVATSEDPRWRWHAIRGLEALGEAATGPLVALASSEGLPPRPRIEAAGALGPIGGPGAVEGLRDALKGADGEVRFAIAAALARLGADDGIEAVVSYLGDRDRATREYAVDALGASDNPLALPHLMDALEDRDHLVRTRAELFLREMTGQDLGSDAQSWRDWAVGRPVRVDHASSSETDKE